MDERLSRIARIAFMGLLVVGPIGRTWAQGDAAPAAPPAQEVPAQPQPAPPAEPAQAPDEAASLTSPPEIPEAQLGPVLQTVPVSRNMLGPNLRMIDARVLPRDREGIWVLDFAFFPIRLRTVELPDKGRRVIHYLYYEVVNNTGEQRMFVPQFTLVTDTGQRLEDDVIPQAIGVIQAREEPTRPLLGAVESVGILPPNSGKENIDDAVFGVAVWDGVDPQADRFSIYVRGLSDGYREVVPPSGGDPIKQYKTLRIDFIRRGDERDLRESEIQLANPPYEWVYW